MKDSKVVNAWCLYDWANSVYSLTITSAIFPIYYQAVAVGKNDTDVIHFFNLEIVNSVLYSYSLSLSFLLVAVILPLLSGVADYTGKKKLFLKAFMFLGSFSCIGLFFFKGNNIEWGIFCSVFASVGFSASLVFYDAFLPEIAPADQTDRISAKGYSWGYIGGVILLIINLITIEQWDLFGFPDQGTATRFAFLTVGVWWIVFALLSLSYLPDNVYNRKPTGRILLNGYKELRKVWFELKHLPGMRRYLLAFFFYNTGVQTVMYLAATFGSKELHLEASKLIMTVLIIQFVGVAGAYFFAFLSRKKGNIPALLTMIIIWIGICISAFFVTNETEFYILATVVGLVMGGIQSLSRATFSKLIPSGSIDHTSFFSFYDVTFNVSIVVGTFSYGLVEQITGSMRNSTLALASFFIIGLIVLITVRVPNARLQATKS